MAKRGAAKRKWLIFTAVAAVLIASFCRVKIVPDAAPAGEASGAGAAVSVPEAWVGDNWESRILPAIDERAVDPAVFAEGMKADPAALGAKYATRANETSPWSFCLKGTVRVLSVENPDAATKTRLLADTRPYDGVPDLKIQTSTVIRTNAVRDAVGFLKLDDFANQVEFAGLTRAINARIQQDVLRNLDLRSLVGKEIELTGCVSVSARAGQQAKQAEEVLEEALVVPVRIAPVAPGE